MTTETLQRAFAEIVGPENVMTDPPDLATHILNPGKIIGG